MTVEGSDVTDTPFEFKPGTNVRFEAKATRTDGSNDTLESSPVSVSTSC